MGDGYHWLSKEERIKRNSFILEKKAEGWPLKRIAAQTNLAVRGVEEVIYKAKKKRRKRPVVVEKRNIAKDVFKG